jgi:hypothetical protein
MSMIAGDDRQKLRWCVQLLQSNMATLTVAVTHEGLEVGQQALAEMQGVAQQLTDLSVELAGVQTLVADVGVDMQVALLNVEDNVKKHMDDRVKRLERKLQQAIKPAGAMPLPQIVGRTYTEAELAAATEVRGLEWLFVCDNGSSEH